MKTLRHSLLFLTAAAGAFAQQWEIGGNVGGSFLPGRVRHRAHGLGNHGLPRRGIAAGVWLGQRISRHIGGEVRYNFMQSNLKLESGGTSTNFLGPDPRDLLRHPDPHGPAKESRAQSYRGRRRRHEDLPRHGQGSRLPAAQPVRLPHQDAGSEADAELRRRHEVQACPARVDARRGPRFPDAVPEGSDHARARRQRSAAMLHNIVPMVGISYEY